MTVELTISKLAVAASAFSVSSLASVFFALTEQVQGIMITSLCGLVLGIVTAVFGYLSNKNAKLSVATSKEAKDVAVEAKAAAVESKTIALETGKAVDGRVSSFLEMAKEKFTAVGKAEEKAAQALVTDAKEAGRAEGVAAEQKIAEALKTVPPV